MMIIEQFEILKQSFALHQSAFIYVRTYVCLSVEIYVDFFLQDHTHYSNPTVPFEQSFTQPTQ